MDIAAATELSTFRMKRLLCRAAAGLTHAEKPDWTWDEDEEGNLIPLDPSSDMADGTLDLFFVRSYGRDDPTLYALIMDRIRCQKLRYFPDAND